MVFDIILDDKNKELNSINNHLAKKFASYFNETFKYMNFINNGEHIHVFLNFVYIFDMFYVDYYK